MEIDIDHRIELITVIQTLCNYWDNLAQKYSGKKLFFCEYKENIIKYFEAFKQNEIPDLCNKLFNDETDISAFLTLVLNFSNPPQMSKIFDHYENKYEYFIDSLRKFYKETKFDRFLENNQYIYDKILNDFSNKEELNKEIKIIFEYLDIENINYKIIISPLVFGNFGINTDTKNYIIKSPFDYKDDKYIFGPKESIRNNIWHEIGHTAINDLTKKYFDITKYKQIEISEIFINKFYNNAETIINEYIVRAIANLLEKENNCARALLDYEIKSGFREIEKVKKFIFENCSVNNKFIKDDSYAKLVNFVVGVIG
ncbi:MAG: DUF4932 domain-containing protein [Treponema sp.]|nr:DUF4932 domain-containing protein [Treponema sp.]